MADKIYLRAGNAENMPALADREPAFVRDEKALYIGTPEGNLKLCSADIPQEVEALRKEVDAYTLKVEEMDANLDRKLTATPAIALAELEAEAELAAMVSAYNSLIAALKAGGIMEKD